LSPDDLLQRLDARGRPWPAPIAFLEEVGSTNDVLRQLARDGCPEWSVVVAGRQTAGRGRRGNPWSSPEGNAYVSVLLRPKLNADRLPLIPLAGGLAVSDALRALSLPATLKWPNDVLVNGCKIAGVLAEAASGRDGVESVVLGIGVNVAVDPAHLNPELRGVTTSVRALLGNAPPLLEVVASILDRVVERSAQLAREPGSLTAGFRERFADWEGQAVSLATGAERVFGLVLGVDDQGALRLRLRDGSARSFIQGEVRKLRREEAPS
jgi:BirA family biotin operon repressor/biotin-[acetyl-CoA-carboxylase] ligase